MNWKFDFSPDTRAGEKRSAHFPYSQETQVSGAARIPFAKEVHTHDGRG